jgi:FlaA1/EpsC-like NDP-sugar epimerase
MIVHETVVDPMPGPYEAAVPAAVAPPAPTTRQFPHWLAACAHATLVFVAVWIFLLSDGRAADEAIGVAFVLAGIWVAALALTRSAARQHVLAVGGGGAVVIGTLAGLIAASAAGLWVPDLRLHPISLLGVALSVLVMTAAWRAFLDSRDITPRRLLIVGGGRGALELIETLDQESKLPFQAVAVVDDDHPEDTIAGVPTKGRIKDLPRSSWTSARISSCSPSTASGRRSSRICSTSQAPASRLSACPSSTSTHSVVCRCVMCPLRGS